MQFVRGNDTLQEESGKAVVLAPKRAAGEAAAPTRPSNILGIRKLLEERAAAAAGHTVRPRSVSPPAGQRRASPSYAPNSRAAAAAATSKAAGGSSSPVPQLPAAAPPRPSHSDADSEDSREKARLQRARPANSGDSFESDEAAQRRRAAALATSSSSSDSEGGSSRRGGKHRGRDGKEGNTGRSQHRSNLSGKARSRSPGTDRDKQRQQQRAHDKRSSRSRSRSRHRRRSRDRSGDVRDSHRHHSSHHGRDSGRDHRSSSGRREGREEQRHGHRHHRSRSRDRSRDRKRRRGDHSRSRSRSGRRARHSRSRSRSRGLQRGPDPPQQQQQHGQRSRGGIGFGDGPPRAAPPAAAAAAGGQDPAASIPGYAQMSALEKLKARTRLALQKADATAAAKAAAAEMEDAEEEGGNGGAGSSRPWTRFVFDKHAELDEDVEDRQQHLDAAVGMGGFHSLQSLAGGIGVDRQGDTGVFDRDDVELAAGQASFLGGAAQRRQRRQEAAHEAAIFGAPAGTGGGLPGVSSSSRQLGQYSTSTAAGALHGGRPGGSNGAVWEADHGRGLGAAGAEDVVVAAEAGVSAAAGAGAAAGELLCEQVVAQKPLSWRERAALKRARQ